MTPSVRPLALAVCASIALLALTPPAFGASAVDQYQEGIPTAGGQQPTRHAVDRAGSTQSGTRIPAPARAQLERSKKGSAAAKAARITAPNGSGSGPSDAGGGLGLLLPLILVATLAAAVGVFVARRRARAAPG
jgi:hypothetical protein